MVNLRTILFVIILNKKWSSATVKNPAKIECGYKQCPQTRDGALNVHLIPHSHMDAGWVKTFDEYFHGTKTSTSTANVQIIYHSVISELLHDKRRKFTFSETAFFWRWWKEQRPATRTTFRSLVQEGRVEFAGGGWVENDEATTDYLQIIDQYTWGLRKINDTLGPCGKPKAAWQIDSYGHSREQISLLAQMGFDGLFIGRVDHNERLAMIEEDRMEFIWRGSDVLGKMSDIMTHTLYNLYNAPDGFCFDYLCNDEPIVDDPDHRIYNADRRVNDFVAQLERQAKYYNHDNIMITMGGDFTYQSASHWYINMDKLINHVNTHPANLSDINIFYSTPSCYLKAIYLYGRRDKAVYTETRDYLPYGSDSSTYWTGYYSSRPSLKYLAKRAHVFLQVVKQLTVIARMGDSYELHLLRHAVALILHHDAITGTSQQHVSNDFIRIVTEAIEACTKTASNLLSTLTPTWGGSRRSRNYQQFTVCHQLNMSQCRFTENQESMLLLVYNPLSFKTYHYVRLPAVALQYSIRDSADDEVDYQLVPLPTAVINLPGRSTSSIQELVFEAENIPPLGFVAFYISAVPDQMEENEYAKKIITNTGDQELVPYIANEYLKVTVNKDTGLLDSIQHLEGVSVKVQQNFFFYSQSQKQSQHSGAYSFRPNQERPTPVADKVAYHAVRGTMVKEIRQRFNDWITQIIRLYRGEEFLEMEWIIGPVPLGTDMGKEVVSVFSTNITNNGQFFTDSNGKMMMKRSCWNETAGHVHKKKVSACYFPVTSRICINGMNSSAAMCVLTDRTQGGTSFMEGQIELMVHRRLLTDDGFGLEEPLNEEEYGSGLVIKGRHRIMLGNYNQQLDGMTFSERVAQGSRRWSFEPWLFLTPGEKITRRKWQNIRSKRFSALRLHGLPRHVRILTLEPWKAGSVLLRLENTLEKSITGRMKREQDKHSDFSNRRSNHVTVDLRKIFVQLQVRAVRETTLAANQWLDDARQMDWSTRYVYKGGEEGILPEDNLDYNPETEEVHKRESEETNSEEGLHGSRKYSLTKSNKRNRQKNHDSNYSFQMYDRRKRSTNATENFIENIFNNTFVDIFEELLPVNDPPKTIEVTKTSETPEDFNKTDKFIYENDTIVTTKNETSETTTPLNVFRMATTKRSPKLNPLYTKKKIVDQIPISARVSEELASSEEDFLRNLKNRYRRSKKKLNRNRQKVNLAEINTDAEDDGVTKSIFEMYYKNNLKTDPYKNPNPYKNSEEYETTVKYKQKHRMQRNKQAAEMDDDDLSDEVTSAPLRYRKMPKSLSRNGYGRRYKEARDDERGDRRVVKHHSNRRLPEISKPDISYVRGQKLRNEIANKGPKNFDFEEGTEMDNDDFDEGDGFDRRKRFAKSTTKDGEMKIDVATTESAEQADEDFLITLRPTQIRTFVVWFDDRRMHSN